MLSPNRIIAIIAIAVVASLATLYTTPGRTSQDPYNIERYINGKLLYLDIARSDTEHYQGLSDRQRMCDECGMLFVFRDLEQRVFVMRRMNFPLDFIWLAKGKVIHIDRNAQPESGPYTPYTTAEPVDSVIELNAGAADRYGLQEGQVFELPRL